MEKILHKVNLIGGMSQRVIAVAEPREAQSAVALEWIECERG